MRFLAILFTTFMLTPAFAGVQGFAGTTNLGIFSKIKCSTGITCTNSSGYLNMVSSPTLSGSQNISGAEAGDAVLSLWADEGDDAADKFSITATAADALVFKNNATSIFAFSSAGVMTLGSDEVIDNSVDDTINFLSNDEHTTLQITGFEAKDAILNMYSDQGDDNADKFRIRVSAADVMSFDNNGTAFMSFSSGGAVTGAGNASFSGFLRKQVASTTASITAAQCGSTFVSDSADVIVLPEASTVLGCRLTFVCGTTDDFDINPADGTDQIGPVNVVGGGAASALAPAAGDAIRCTDIGSSIMIEAVGANLWAAIGVANGPWTDVN